EGARTRADARPDADVLEGRPREGRDRARTRQAGDRQAPRHRQARRRPRDATGAEVPALSAPGGPWAGPPEPCRTLLRDLGLAADLARRVLRGMDVDVRFAALERRDHGLGDVDLPRLAVLARAAQRDDHRAGDAGLAHVDVGGERL